MGVSGSGRKSRVFRRMARLIATCVESGHVQAVAYQRRKFAGHRRRNRASFGHLRVRKESSLADPNDSAR